VFVTGQGRKADVTDALWIAGRHPDGGLRPVVDDQHIVPSRAVRTLQSAGE